jgi:hypothetical protein
MGVGDPRDLYREQLRFAENVLAFLASLCLALLREEDRDGMDLDLRKYWSGGISFGDWKLGAIFRTKNHRSYACWPC